MAKKKYKKPQKSHEVKEPPATYGSGAENEIQITLTDKDEEVHEFEINYQGKVILLNCKLEIIKDTLYLSQVDMEGSGANTFGNKMKSVIREIAMEFCRIYKTKRIEITGAIRTAGRTKGTYMRTITYNFTNQE